MTLRILLLAATVLLSLPAQITRAATDASAVDSSAAVIPDSGHVIVAYYFYTTLRCENCLRIEAWSREALDSAFSSELSEGLLWWRPLNTDSSLYAHFIGDYSLVQKSLIIAEFKDGARVRWKNCERVWDLLEDETAFLSYVQSEVSEYLFP